MAALQILSSFIPLLIIGGVVWAIVSSRRSSHSEWDPGASVGRFLVYAVLFVTMVVASAGLSGVAAQLFTDDAVDREGLAVSMAMAIVALPVFALVLRFVRTRLRSRRERQALSWWLYFNVAQLVSLVVAVVMGVTALERMFSGELGRATVGSVLAAGVWFAMWSLHWFGLRRAHQVPGDLHRAAAAVVGLVTLAVGAVEVVYHLFDALYTQISGDPLLDRGGPSGAASAATLTVGLVVWAFFWLLDYRKGPRTTVWYLAVVPIASLASYVMAAVATALVANSVLVWFVGDPSETSAVRHFDHLPAEGAFALVGLAGWAYHRWVFGQTEQRTEPVRVYQYLLAGAGLVTGVVGSSILLSSALAPARSGRLNTAIAGVVVVVLGASVWARHWASIRRALGHEPDAEYASTSRHVYVFALFAASLVTCVVSFIVLLAIGLTDLFEGRFSMDTLHQARGAIAVVASVAMVAWYHVRLWLAEHDRWTVADEVAAVSLAGRRHLMLVAPAGTDVELLAGYVPGATWHVLVRTDVAAARPPDVSAFCSQVGHVAGDAVVVVEGDGGVDVIAVDDIDAALPRGAIDLTGADDHDLVV
ncbi:MAG: hypothetical protein KDB16_11415 [Acidimicrobiales bacterium]|nr:hypothetical protein [Acidimicrobiales bacterium]